MFLGPLTIAMNVSRSTVLRRLLCVLFIGASLSAIPDARAADSPETAPLVYAAASLTDVLQKIGMDYQRDHQRSVRFAFGSSATLARQIEAGAPADLFIAADQDWMNYLAERRLIDAGSRRDLLGNTLVLIAPADSKAGVILHRRGSLNAALGTDGRLALADPASVPAGKYAKAALTKLGLWADLQSRIVSADNVRAALMFVARGEAPLGVVYETDARAEPRVRVVATFPESTHAPIIYPIARTVRAAPAAEAFRAYLATPAARARFEAAGFRVRAP